MVTRQTNVVAGCGGRLVITLSNRDAGDPFTCCQIAISLNDNGEQSTWLISRLRFLLLARTRHICQEVGWALSGQVAFEDSSSEADLSLQIQSRWTARRFSFQAYVPSTPLRE